MNKQFNHQFETKETNSFAIAGFILALLAIFLFWVPFLDFIIWILGGIFSIIGIVQAGKLENGMGLSIAGLIISFLSPVLLLFGGIAFVMMFLSGAH
ncbi:hypothetical protein [Neptunitalea lumnitzerae]|uniref:DUF4190 domain-containing protein n=1 Tax=Neptunitalea lumnitzerae TaxID=2965509 RepID=A0ABQ5MFX3_9FLAO|nr:hypothetical protein [Neptunitalea sp. Y10]GLB47930.1 hypothetical protein Y10_02980 [Neptunitalea sp. Y10]